MTKCNVAVIGLGNMGKHHVRNFSNIETANLVAVCDIQEDIVQEFSSKYNCKGYTNLQEMINSESIDAVSITAPTKYHFELAKFVLENNINVLVEKPICDNEADADILIELAEKNNLTLTVGHIERFNPAVLKLKEIIDNGALGKVTSIIAKRVGAFPAQIKDANVIIDLAVHDIDIMSYLLDKDPDQIYGNAGRALIDGREDYAEVFLTYGDQNGFIQVNWITPIRIRNLAVTGTKGYAELNYMTQELTLYESNYAQDFDSFGDYIIKFGTPNKKDISLEKGEPLNIELRHFIDCVINKKTPLITGERGKKALSIALEVMQKMNIC